jgi:hypothetical protein
MRARVASRVAPGGRPGPRFGVGERGVVMDGAIYPAPVDERRRLSY